MRGASHSPLLSQLQDVGVNDGDLLTVDLLGAGGPPPPISRPGAPGAVPMFSLPALGPTPTGPTSPQNFMGLTWNDIPVRGGRRGVPVAHRAEFRSCSELFVRLCVLVCVRTDGVFSFCASMH